MTCGHHTCCDMHNSESARATASPKLLHEIFQESLDVSGSKKLQKHLCSCKKNLFSTQVYTKAASHTKCIGRLTVQLQAQKNILSYFLHLAIASQS